MASLPAGELLDAVVDRSVIAAGTAILVIPKK
jgi:hypothetical protein